MATPKITLSALVGSFCVIDLTTRCKATHSPKDRRGMRVTAAEALDDHGDLRKRYEAVCNKDGTPTGEYALRADAPVYAAADERLKSALRSVNALLDKVCYTCGGGGTRILTEANYGEWDNTLKAIADEVSKATEEINAMRIDEDDSSSPLINDFLIARGRKPIGLRFSPLRHPEVMIADPDAQEQARAFVRATRKQVQDVIAAVQSADPDKIAAVLQEAKNIENAIADEGTRVSIRRLLDAAQRAKAAAQVEREKDKAAAKAQERLNNRTGTDSRAMAAVDRDSAAILRFQTESVQAADAKRRAIADLLAPAADLTERFAGLDLGSDDDEIAGPDVSLPPGTAQRTAGLDVRETVQHTEAEQIAEAARQVTVNTGPHRNLDVDTECSAEMLP